MTYKNSQATAGDVAAVLSRSPAALPVRVDAALVDKRCPADFDRRPFWDALETLAEQTKARIAPRDGGRQVLLEPLGSRPRERSAVSGPFRVVARKITAVSFLDGGPATYELELEVHWEPRLPVFRIDSQPRITRAEDDRGNALVTGPPSTWQYPGTAPRADLSVKLGGLSRAAASVGVLAGEFRVTAAERLLTVRFPRLGGKFPLTVSEDRVTVALRSFEKVGTAWEAEVELLYPEGQPLFESFEEQRWLRDTRLRLVGPDGRTIEPDGEDATASGRRVTATYRFKTEANPTAQGWSLVCETPSPLVEAKVHFQLTNVPLP